MGRGIYINDLSSKNLQDVLEEGRGIGGDGKAL